MERNNQSGYVLVTVAISLVALIGFAALAIDVGYLYSKRANYQRAADAAALAGAFTYVVDSNSSQPGTATADAIEVATSNTVMGTAIDPAQVTVTFPASPLSGGHLVQVSIQAPSETFFAQIFGVSSSTIAVTATAEAAPAPTGATCVKPWFIPNSFLSALLGTAPCTACQNQDPSSSTLMITVDASGKRSVTQYALSQLGKQFLITAAPLTTLSPGQYFSLQDPNNVSDSGNLYSNDIAMCSPSWINCGSAYGVIVGAKVGPTSSGVAGLLNSPADVWVGIGQYAVGGGSTISDTSRQLVLAPLWDTCNSLNVAGTTAYCPAGSFPSGTTPQVAVLGFALIFVDGMNGNQVSVHLANVEVCGAGSAEQGQSPYGIPVRLVHQ